MPENIVAMIPARAGSERLQSKNLRLLDGKPVISYVIEAAKRSGVFWRIVINSDTPVFEEIAARYGVEFYARPPALGSSETKSDDVVADFMDKHPCDIAVWVNPIAPLQPAEEIKAVIEHFAAEKLDSLITVKNEQLHCVFDGRPINFREDELFAKTQDLKPVQSFVYSIMMWRTENFMAHYRRDGFALLSGKVGYFPVCKESTIILKYEEDLQMMEAVLRARRGGAPAPTYDSVLTD